MSLHPARGHGVTGSLTTTVDYIPKLEARIKPSLLKLLWSGIFVAGIRKVTDTQHTNT